MAEREERAAVAREARRWIATPYHHFAAVMGGGIDCAHILIETFAGAGLIERFVPDEYPIDWHMHRSEERYLAVVERYCGLVDEDFSPLATRSEYWSAAPGDVIMFRWGRTFSHSAIVTDWPMAVHAFAHEKMVIETNLRAHASLAERECRVYSFWKGR